MLWRPRPQRADWRPRSGSSTATLASTFCYASWCTGLAAPSPALLNLFSSACSAPPALPACSPPPAFSPPPTFLLSSACSPPPALLRLLSFRLLSSACSPALLRLLSSDDSGISQAAYHGWVHSARQRGELFLRHGLPRLGKSRSAAAYPPYPPGEERSHFAQTRYSNYMRWYILPPIGKGQGRSGFPTDCEADA